MTTLKIERDRASSVMCYLTRIQCTDKVTIFFVLSQSRTLIISISLIKLFKLLESHSRDTHFICGSILGISHNVWNVALHMYFLFLQRINFRFNPRTILSHNFSNFDSLIEKSKELIIIQLH